MGIISTKQYRNTVFIEYTHKGRRLKMSTGIRLAPGYIKKGELSSRAPDYYQIDQTINVYKNLVRGWVNQVISERKEPTVENIKAVRDKKQKEKEAQQERKNYLQDDFAKYLEHKKNRVKPSTYRNIQQASKALIDYETEAKRKMTVDDLTSTEFDKFVNYLMRRNLKNNMIAKHTKIIRGFLRWAYPRMQLELAFVKYQYVTPNIHYLRGEEMRLLIDAELPTAKLDKTRDLFVFLATTGMRYSDSQQFRSDWINENVIQYNALKTGNRATTYLGNAPKRIIEKYNGAVPKLSGQKFNEYLKELLTVVGITRNVQISEIRGGEHTQYYKPINEVITSQMGRNTFITLCFLREVPLETIMDMVGTADYKSLRPYAEEVQSHIEKVSKYWEF